MISERAVKAIESSDTDELIRIVDGHTDARDWPRLAELRRRCDEAVTRGKQLWGISEYIRYRFALDAPGEWAGPAVTEGRTRFTLGPLPEVAASTKSWAELDAHLAPGPERAITAHERVLRGEVLESADIDRHVMELPLSLQSWEPPYRTITYKSDRVESATPALPRFTMGDLPPAGTEIDDADGCTALLALVEPWVETSNGRAQARCVEGDAPRAIAALGVARAGIAEVEPGQALEWMAWAGASGGAHGRRRGAAAGRFSTWWAAHELAGLDWPPTPDGLGEAVGELQWYLFSDGSPDTGWNLKLAVESPAEGLAWAISANDAD